MSGVRVLRDPAGWLLAGFVLLALLTFRDYGITWDEPDHSAYGQQVLAWYASGFEDRRALMAWLLPYYGAFAEVVLELGAAGLRLTGLDRYEARHLLGAGFGLLALVGTWRLGRRLGGPWAGLLAVLLLALTPRFYGHAFANSKDIPFAALFVWGLHFLLQAVERLPRPPRATLGKLAVAIGLATAVRVGGLLLLGYALAGALLWGATTRPRPTPRVLAGLTARGMGVAALAYLVALPWWPALQVYGPAHLWASFRVAARYPWDQPVLFAGETLLAQELPRSYVVHWLAIALPEAMGLALVAALAAGAAALWRWSRGGPRPRRGIEVAVLGLAVVFPPAYAAASGATVYDGLRHFLFVLPPLAVLGALGLVRAAERIPRPWLPLAASPLVVAMAVTAADMVALHPYQSVYFNRLVTGGLPGAAGRYELDYWGQSYREGALWLNQHYANAQPGRRLRVATCSYPEQTRHYLDPDRFELAEGPVTPDGPPADLLLATPRWGCDERLEGRVVHQVRRQGVPLLAVKELSPRTRP